MLFCRNLPKDTELLAVRHHNPALCRQTISLSGEQGVQVPVLASVWEGVGSGSKGATAQRPMRPTGIRPGSARGGQERWQLRYRPRGYRAGRY